MRHVPCSRAMRGGQSDLMAPSPAKRSLTSSRTTTLGRTRCLNSSGSASAGIFDDWAVWTRELSDAELTAV